tara:strand:- start:3243 stop:4850 length:1608 start_codon:yes stop_codon:yes gene_type:complete
MAESVTYGSYTFPTPTPLVGQGVDPVYVGGSVDHFRESIDLVGTLTGENLSGLHLQKMKMVSGLLSEFQTLTISNDTANKTFTSVLPENIGFGDSDLTTVLPYSVTFASYSSGTFSKFFGVESPQDTWDFSEEDGRVTVVSHNVSAQGVKVGSTSALVNARNFVTGRVTGCLNLSLFQTGGDDSSFLFSRTENVDRATNIYGITESYKYSTSENPITDSGILTSNTQISFDNDAGLSVKVNASVQGSMDANKGGTGLLHTGIFTADQAQEVAINAVVSSLSDFESGAYTFIDRGPKSVSYNIDTGTNKIDFSYQFSDPANLDQEGNVLHTKSASVAASKDESTIKVTVQGELKYNGVFDIFSTGDPATGERFKEIDAQYSGIINNSGFLNLAIEALKDFREDATGYHISGDFINPEPISKSITKSPAQSVIGYSAQFDNRIDLSSGTLSGLKVTIDDKRPIELSGIVPSLGGFAKQKIMNRTAGEYQVSATCEASTGDLQTLINVVSGHATGVYVFSESSSVNEATISYNMSRYY